MTLPSFSLQSTLALSDPRWSVRIFILFLCILDSLGFCALVGDLEKDPGY